VPPTNRLAVGKDPFNINNYLNKISAATRVACFRKKQVVLSHGEDSDAIFYVEEGSVKLTVTSDEGKEALIAVRAPGTFLGENAIVKNPARRSYNAIALIESRLLKIERNALRLLIHTVPEVSDALISCVIGLNLQIQERMANALLYSNEKQLAQTLLTLSRLRDGIPQGHAPTLNQQELANMIGITRQRINVLLQGFRKSGFIGDGLKVNPSITAVLRGEGRRGNA
jgi:CRP/FNR family transcriptional regulator, cyclic AMP receptor protein